MFHVKHLSGKNVDEIGAIEKKGGMDRENLLVGNIPNIIHRVSKKSKISSAQFCLKLYNQTLKELVVSPFDPSTRFRAGFFRSG